MRRLLIWTDALFLGTAALLAAGFLGCVTLQVVFRYVIQEPLPWSEEAARYLFVWTAFLAAAVTVGRNDQFSISLFVERLPAGWRWRLDLLGTALGILFAGIIVSKGAAMSWRLLSATSPVLQLPQGAVYAVIPVSGLYMVVHLTVRFVALVRGEPGVLGEPC